MKSPIEQAVESLNRFQTNLEASLEKSETSECVLKAITSCLSLLIIHQEYEAIYYQQMLLKDRIERLAEENKVNV